MATIKEKVNKHGERVFDVRVYHAGKQLTRSWTAPSGWSASAINRAVQRFASDLERQYKNGEILTRQQCKDAEAKAAEELEKILTVRKYTEQVYLPNFKTHAAGTTIENFTQIINAVILPAIGDKRITEVTAADISKILSDYQLTGKAHATVIKLYTVLQQIFKSAFWDETISINPMQRVLRPRPREDESIQTEPDSLSIADVQQLLSVMESQPLKWQTYIQLSLRTGARRGELLGLHWDDFDSDNKTLTISRSLCYVKTRGIYEKTPKNRRRRVIAIDDTSIKYLKELRRQQLHAGIISQYVFTQDDSSEPMHPDSPTHYLTVLSKAHHLPHLHPHQLRHTFASLAITNGADVVSVSEILGHADTAITLRTYAHANEESKRRTIDIFSQAIKAASNE